LFLHIRRNGQMHWATPAGIRCAHGAGDEIRDATGVMHHPRALGKRLRGADLVDFLHGASP
jgi:hypothetical protein